LPSSSRPVANAQFWARLPQRSSWLYGSLSFLAEISGEPVSTPRIRVLEGPTCLHILILRLHYLLWRWLIQQALGDLPLGSGSEGEVGGSQRLTNQLHHPHGSRHPCSSSKCRANGPCICVPCIHRGHGSACCMQQPPFSDILHCSHFNLFILAYLVCTLEQVGVCYTLSRQ